jgi:nucleoid-associated protein YgaU
MAKKERKKRKGILRQAVDALTDRDEQELAKKAEEEAEAAEHQATLERAKREAAEAKARAAEKKLEEMEAKLKEAEKDASQAEAKASRVERARRREEVARRREKMDEARELKRRVREKAAEEAEARTYVVKSGDSLSKIAKELLGDAGRWPEIFEANKDKIKDPNLIYPGQELDIPS